MERGGGNGGARVLCGGGCKGLRKKAMGEGRGAAEKTKGIRGGAARVRRTSGSDQEPRPNSFTRQLPTPSA